MKSDLETDHANGPVFVTGVWKSGNHLVYSALNQLGIEGPFNGFAAHLLFGRGRVVKHVLRGAWPGGAGIDVGLETEVRVRPAYLRSSLRKLQSKIVGGHTAYSDALLTLLRSEKARIIVIRRDPRDVLVSFADWIESRPDYFMHADFMGLTREARVARLLHGGTGTGYTQLPFAEMLSRAHPWMLAGRDVLNVSFEDLIGPNGGSTRGRQERSLASICEHLGLNPPHDPAWIEDIYGGTLTFKEGRIQRWRELDSRDLQDEIAELLATDLPAWGYTADEGTMN